MYLLKIIIYKQRFPPFDQNPLKQYEGMLQKNLKKERIRKTSVSIIVSQDVNAICALRILTFFLNRENLQFQMIPVSGYSEMTEVIQKCGNMQKSIILLNCGNVYDMSEFVKGDIKFFYLTVINQLIIIM
ncbi:unnamed protein product [Paramecium sonneborni]|uniref:Uncharacterized protein n=1 Tax=Paramecium sonneborni TaxID=65129 RepID=A0A8S1NH81_9CILI|nr:unnamed protein product [Paramecium sonneborni]